VNVYVETNFVLEMVFEQEQSSSCEEIVQFCESGHGKLVLPAYSLAEPHEKLVRQANTRQILYNQLDTELAQLARTSSYREKILGVRDIAGLLIQSNEEERRRFGAVRERILKIGDIVPLSTEILQNGASYEKRFDLRPQDAIVYASVISHLQKSTPPTGCFLNRNSKDFDNPDIADELKRFNCRMIPRFDHGCSYIRSATPKPSE